MEQSSLPADQAPRVSTVWRLREAVIAIGLFGEDKWVLGVGTLAVTFAILVFSEITPKIIGATYADRLAIVLGYILTPLLRFFYPAVWFINLL